MFNVNKNQGFNELISNLRVLRANVYGNRIDQTKELIRVNEKILRISSFELMEHNFRENSHSNVLQYIFNYTFCGDVSCKVLNHLIKQIDCGQNDLCKKIDQKKYRLQRESRTDKGRIDILITDDENKFVIVIENKLLARISFYEEGEETDCKRSQLDEYRSFIERGYPDYDKIFIILSYNEVVEDYSLYKKINYSNIFDALNTIETEDRIIDDYKLLLYTLTNNIHHKKWLIERAKNIMSDAEPNISLNNLEELNKLLIYEQA